MEVSSVENISSKMRKINTGKLVRFGIILSLAITVGYIHYKYVSNLFENDRNFMYLSEVEREMSLRTEMGFYYSYYKTVVEEKPFVAITKIMYDKLVEFPNEVNAFNRFNIHPEVMLGALYRCLEPVLNTTSLRQCHIVDRGEGLTPVESCIGIGQPIFFYLEAIWILAGLTAAALFLHATSLSDSVLGGLLAVAHYFANHSECTRVQWAPNERENLAAPLLLLHSWLVSEQLRDRRKNNFQLQVTIFILNSFCLLFWQFSQFIFLAETAIFFVMEQLKIIDIKQLSVFLHSHFCGLHTAVLLLQGNDMLKSSLYTSFFLVVSTYCLFFSSFRIKVQNRVDLLVESWLILLRITIVVCASFYLKKIVSDFLEVQEDSHIWDILYSKFTDYKSFHTLIYTCSEVFDFLPFSSIKKLFSSFLIPMVLISVFNVVNYWIRVGIFEYARKTETQDAPNEEKRDKTQDDDDSGIENSDGVRKRKLSIKDLDVIDKQIKSKFVKEERKHGLVLILSCLRIDAAIFYNVSQLAVFAAMAALVMRLKLLFVTQLCVVSSLFMNKYYFFLPKPYVKYLPFFWVLMMAPVTYNMFYNVLEEMSHVGEFTDIQQEQLLEWIKSETSGGAFAGSMPILATVMLVTRRPIVAHPHYEHKGARDRAYAVYKTYGRFTPQELYQELTKLRATYLIVETKYCYGRSNKGCTFAHMWDVEVGPRGTPIACHALLTRPQEHFYPLFRNQQYAVFRIHDLSVRYMPRSFDT